MGQGAGGRGGGWIGLRIRISKEKEQNIVKPKLSVQRNWVKMWMRIAEIFYFIIFVTFAGQYGSFIYSFSKQKKWFKLSIFHKKGSMPSFIQCAGLRLADNQHFWLKKELLVSSYKASNAVKIGWKVSSNIFSVDRVYMTSLLVQNTGWYVVECFFFLKTLWIAQQVLTIFSTVPN